MNPWPLLVTAILTEVAATLALRAAVDGSAAWYVVVAAGYLAAFVLLAAVLRRGLAVGVAYGIWAAAGVALTATLGAVLFDEPLTPTMLAGIAFVIVGVLLTETGSHAAAAPEGTGDD